MFLRIEVECEPYRGACWIVTLWGWGKKGRSEGYVWFVRFMLLWWWFTVIDVCVDSSLRNRRYLRVDCT